MYSGLDFTTLATLATLPALYLDQRDRLPHFSKQDFGKKDDRITPPSASTELEQVARTKETADP